MCRLSSLLSHNFQFSPKSLHSAFCANSSDGCIRVASKRARAYTATRVNLAMVFWSPNTNKRHAVRQLSAVNIEAMVKSPLDRWRRRALRPELATKLERVEVYSHSCQCDKSEAPCACILHRRSKVQDALDEINQCEPDEFRAPRDVITAADRARSLHRQARTDLTRPKIANASSLAHDDGRR